MNDGAAKYSTEAWILWVQDVEVGSGQRFLLNTCSSIFQSSYGLI